jgi:hypothetical protein
MGLRDRQQGDRQQIVMRFRDVAENSVGSIPSAISTISMPDSHVLPSLQAQAASTLDAAIGCQDENDAADQRQEIESLGKELSREGIEPSTRRLRVVLTRRPRLVAVALTQSSIMRQSRPLSATARTPPDSAISKAPKSMT